MEVYNLGHFESLLNKILRSQKQNCLLAVQYFWYVILLSSVLYFTQTDRSVVFFPKDKT